MSKENKIGLCSMSSTKENNILACPDTYEGGVNVHIYGISNI